MSGERARISPSTTRQSSLQPSPEALLPSSQASSPVRMPSPHPGGFNGPASEPPHAPVMQISPPPVVPVPDPLCTELPPPEPPKPLPLVAEQPPERLRISAPK
ncbi:Hypothetical protein A7982_06571 [Minicystis rosea]|nr:Hypothetical protein A7982_06571 [Minicystis rosea]